MAVVTLCCSPYGYVDGYKSIDFILKEQLKGKKYEVNKNLEIDTDFFDRKEIEEELRENYEAFGVEEYFLADSWCDDDDGMQKVVQKIYTESVYHFLKSLENITEDGTLNYYDSDVIEFAIDNYGTEDFMEHLDDICIYDDVEDFYTNILELMEAPTSVKTLALYTFMWLDEDTRFNFMNAQGYQCHRLNDGRCLTWY